MRSLIVGLLLLLALPVQAQTVPPPGTLTVTSQGVTSAVWGFESQFGACLTVGVQTQGGWSFPYSPIGCTPDDQVLNYPGGPTAWIAGWLPNINSILADVYPSSSGNAAVNGINSGLQTAYKFTVAPNGTVTFGTK